MWGNSVFTGTGGLTKTGAGTLTFGANTAKYTGGTIVQNGRLGLYWGNNKLPQTGDVTVTSPGILDLAYPSSPGTTQTIGGLSGSGTVFDLQQWQCGELRRRQRRPAGQLFRQHPERRRHRVADQDRHRHADAGRRQHLHRHDGRQRRHAAGQRVDHLEHHGHQPGHPGRHGTITGNVSGTGTVNPGNSPGTLTVTGNYSSSTTFEINDDPYTTAGGDYDQIIVNGAANSVDFTAPPR